MPVVISMGEDDYGILISCAILLPTARLSQLLISKLAVASSINVNLPPSAAYLRRTGLSGYRTIT